MHLLSTADWLPVEWAFLPTTANDVRALGLLPLNLPQGSVVYADKAFTDYEIEDDLEAAEAVTLKAMRKKNYRHQDPPWTRYVKQCTRHFIETVFSQITRHFPKVIHAVTVKGILLKVSSFIFAFTLKQAFL